MKFVLLVVSLCYCLSSSTALDFKKVLPGEWEVQSTTTSVENKFQITNEVSTLKVNVTEEKDNLIRARFIDPENDIFLSITLEWETPSTGRVLVDDDATSDNEEKELFHFELFNRTSGHLISQGEYNALSGKPSENGYYQLLVDHSGFILNFFTNNGQRLTTIHAMKLIKKAEPGFLAKFSLPIMMVVMIIISRFMRGFAPNQPQRSQQTQETRVRRQPRSPPREEQTEAKIKEISGEAQSEVSEATTKAKKQQ
jgi:hypothetical protein